MPRTLVEKLRATARKWRVQNQHTTGVVLIFEGTVYGWKNCLRDAAHEFFDIAHFFVDKG